MSMKCIQAISIVFVFLLSFSVSLFGQQKSTKSYVNDTSSVQNLLDAYYNCISGPIGQKRDFDRLKNLFHPTVKFTYSYWNTEGTKASVMVFKSVEEYISKLGYLDKKGFYEQEIANKTNQFGAVIQVFSSYKYWVEDRSIPSNRGVTSYEIFYDGNRYWFLSMFWMSENEKYRIPAKYVKN